MDVTFSEKGKSKIAAYWLTYEESQDPDIMEKVDADLKARGKHGYTVGVAYSSSPPPSTWTEFVETMERLEERMKMWRMLQKLDLSKEVGSVFCHADDEPFDPYIGIKTYKDLYDRSMFVVNYGKSVKARVKKDKPTRYRGYASKVSIAAYEIDEYDTIGHWLTTEEYEKLSDRRKQEYSYYEWDDVDDWYKVYNLIVDRVDAMLGYFCRWADYAIKDANLDERYPSADYVRLIVYRN